jgi:endonuclease/exonuclease/phosphatase family metal-dependent hydrolase
MGMLIALLALTGVAQELNVMSYNIRLDVASDGVNAWPNRAERVAGLLRFHAPDVVGLQEAMRHQIDALSQQLPAYEWVGTGRDDGRDAGELAPIFFRTDRFLLEDHGQFWLSETPETPSYGWGASYRRICTWVLLRERQSGLRLRVLNTHFDHEVERARQQSAELILERLEAWQQSDPVPVVLMGDLNTLPTSIPLRRLTEVLEDARTVSQEPPYGPVGTFNGFDWDAPLQDRIDYVLVSGEWQVRQYAALTDSQDQRYPSDHLPVWVRLSLSDSR